MRRKSKRAIFLFLIDLILNHSVKIFYRSFYLFFICCTVIITALFSKLIKNPCHKFSYMMDSPTAVCCWDLQITIMETIKLLLSFCSPVQIGQSHLFLFRKISRKFFLRNFESAFECLQQRIL